MEYEISIKKNGEEISRSEITADQVIDLLLTTEKPIVEGREMKEELDQGERVVKKKRKQSTCSKCGKKGHQARTCTSTKEEPEEESEEDTDEGAMSAETFSAVRNQKHEQRSIEEVAEAMGLEEDEVRYAFRAVSYETYKSIRN